MCRQKKVSIKIIALNDKTNTPSSVRPNIRVQQSPQLKSDGIQKLIQPKNKLHKKSLTRRMALRVKPWDATALAVDAAIGMRLKEEKASAKARQQENHVVDVLDDW
jgi:hypothetical protein